MILPVLGLGMLLVVASKKGRVATADNSAREDEPPNSLGLPIDARYMPYVPETLLSWRYFWGGPAFPVPGLHRGAVLAGLQGDCTGLSYCLQVEAGIWPEDFPRLVSGDFWTGSRFQRIADMDIRPGDVLCYPGHIAICVGGAGSTCTVWSNSGGGKTTFGNDPNARPKLFSGPRYRKDYLGAVRLR